MEEMASKKRGSKLRRVKRRTSLQFSLHFSFSLSLSHLFAGYRVDQVRTAVVAVAKVVVAEVVVAAAALQVAGFVNREHTSALARSFLPVSFLLLAWTCTFSRTETRDSPSQDSTFEYLSRSQLLHWDTTNCIYDNFEFAFVLVSKQIMDVEIHTERSAR